MPYALPLKTELNPDPRAPELIGIVHHNHWRVVDATGDPIYTAQTKQDCELLVKAANFTDYDSLVQVDNVPRVHFLYKGHIIWIPTGYGIHVDGRQCDYPSIRGAIQAIDANSLAFA